jgi:hypothetical protein
MKKHLIYSLTLLSTAFVITQSCKHEPTEPIAQNTTTGTTTSGTTTSTLPPNDSVCFNTQILPFFITTCGSDGCHSATNPQKGYNLTTYAGIMTGIVPFQPTQGKIMDEIDDGDMPPAGPLSATQKALLVKWISEGATQRNCNNTCDTTNVTYNNQVSPIVQTYCVGCHNGTSGGGGVNLNSYTAVKTATQTGKVLCSIKHQSGCSAMPKSAAQLNLCQIRIFELWHANGCPQ